MLMVSIGMISSGRVNFVFFTSPEADQAFGNIVMAPGTPRSFETERMLREVERALAVTEDKLTGGKGGLVKIAVASLGTTRSGDREWWRRWSGRYSCRCCC